MQYRNRLSFAVVLIGATLYAISGWTRLTPATAQNSPVPTPIAPSSAPFPGAMRQSPFGGGRFMMPANVSGIAAAGDYVYVVRGTTLYQFRASGLSLVAQKDLPAPPAPQAPPMMSGAPPIAPSTNP